MIDATITTANTAFVLQGTSFVGSPANPAPDQQGGGIWVRSVGGSVDISSTTNGVGSVTPTPIFPKGVTGSVTCSQKVDETFAGVQLGSDIAKLNINGWNLHFGATAGDLEAKGNLVGGAATFTDFFTGEVAGGGPFTSSSNLPFIGAYAAVTNGGFAVDALLRTEYGQSSLTAPGENLFGQNGNMYGASFSSSVTYQWKVPDTNWFIEPSAGILISRVKVDPLNGVSAGTTIGIPTGDEAPGTIQLNDIQSDIVRAGARVGTTIDAGNVIWQPFAVVSVWHEFGPDLTANGVTCPGCASFGVFPITVTGTTTTTNFGTFGQYSLGVAAALADTGWLGFARVDYREGPDLQGLDGTAGIRYQFTPATAANKPAMPVKAAHEAPVAQAVHWAGFYIGAFGGATYGTADWKYASGDVSPHIGGYAGGGDFGYNYQIDRAVIGAEADLENTNTAGAIACGPLAFPRTPLFEMTCNASTRWIGTATTRIGYAFDRALLYVKGGGAWTNEQFSASCNYIAIGCTNPAGAPSTGLTAGTDRGGWVIGFGTEFALTREWAARAEYDYISFGDRNVIASDGSALDLGLHVSEVKIGLNYRFNLAPVLAKD